MATALLVGANAAAAEEKPKISPEMEAAIQTLIEERMAMEKAGPTDPKEKPKISKEMQEAI